jgi:hypothetical protein
VATRNTGDSTVLSTLAGAVLPPGTQVTDYPTGLVQLHYPMPGFLPVTITLLPTKGERPPSVHVACNRQLSSAELDGLAMVLAAADRWRNLQPQPPQQAAMDLGGG